MPGRRVPPQEPGARRRHPRGAPGGGRLRAARPEPPRPAPAPRGADARLTLLVTRGGLAAWRGETPLLDLDAPPAPPIGPLPPPRPSPDDLAYVIYTSGSTGLPKGVGVPHRGVVSLLLDEGARLALAPGVVVLHYASFAFDASVSQLLGPLLHGAQLVIASDEQRQAPDALMRLLREARVAVADLPPSLLAFLDPDQLPDLRALIVGGEACPPGQAVRFARGRRLLNAYGPTETTITCTVWEGAPTGGPLPLGRPCANVRAYVLDGALRPVPPGARGELYVAGVGLARGYLHRPGWTAERFLPDPFGPAGARMYRTGDAARWNEEGELEFLGRVDQQVKVRGFRVELGEIEAALAAHPAVRQCAVVDVKDGESVRLVAYVVGAVPLTELRAHLAQALPEHMVPSGFVPLDALPRTPSGKLDRAALPAPPRDRAGLSTAYVAPRTPEEATLAAIVAEVLGVEPVGVHDDFFELGGDSIKSILVLARAAAAGLSLPRRGLFEARTLARLLEVRRVEPPAAPVAAPHARLEPGLLDRLRARHPDLEDAYPATPMQEGLLFHALHDPNLPFYCEQHCHEILGPIDEARFEAAFAEVVQRHAALRTAFEWREAARPLQVVVGRVRLRFQGVDWQGEPASGEATRVEDWMAVDRRAQFALDQAPLMRFAWLRHGPARRHLVWTSHHLLLDGWSTQTVLDEVVELYRAGREHRAPRLALPIPYVRYVAWLAGLDHEALRAYWRDALRDLGEPCRLRLPAPAVAAPDSGQLRFVLDPALGEGLRALSRAHGLTLATVFQAAWSLVLARASERRDVCFGTVVSGRSPELPGVEGIVGLLINTLPLRVDLEGCASGLDLLRQVQERQLQASDHEGLPLAELQRLGGSAGVALFDTLVVVQNYLVAGERGAGGDFAFGELRTTIQDSFALVLAVVPEAAVRVLLSWDPARLERATVEALAGQLRALLAALVAGPARPVAELARHTAGSPAELSVGSGPVRPLADPRDLPARIAAWAALDGEASAVEVGGARLSRGELVRRANRLAHALAARGVGPEVRVGVLLERSAELVVALLAVLLAGGAYVPLAPDHPAERLAFLASDAKVALLVTRASALRGRLGGLPVLSLDPGSPDAAGDAWPDTAPAPRAHPDDLAYVLYTSGSTGRPKGVAVARRGLVNLVEQLAAVQPFAPDRRALSFASVAFDGMVHELWGALANGAAVVLATAEERLDPGALGALLGSVDTAALTPTVLATLDPAAVPPGFCMVVAGEACPPALAGRWAARCTLVNCYGPTEATVTASYARVDAAALGGPGGVPIGRALPNVRLYVLDERLDPTPRGLVGEIWIAGVGLARGYLDRPALTAERFVPDPYGGPGERMYRTGDRGRWRPDGRLEFVGRVDHEVKVGGVRVDLGEIEARLSAHPAVAEAVVVVGATGRLDAHVVPRIDARAGEGEHVAQRQQFNEELYARQQGGADDEFAGWTSSFDGAPIPREEMLEWVEATVAELAELRPRRVLELGCGSGLVLRRLAPACEAYLGTDLAGEALARIRGVQAVTPGLAHVELRQAAADDPGIPRGRFDLVVINSVVQYFPDAAYLLRVLEAALDALVPGGTLFIGDVRHFALLEAFHAAVGLHRAAGELTRAGLAARVRRAVQDEAELLLDPAFFDALPRRFPRVAWAEVRAKRARHHNELSCFRYQALVHLRGEAPPPPAPEVAWLDWAASGLDLTRLGARLAAERPPVLALTGVPDARLAAAAAALAWLGGDHDETVATYRGRPLAQDGVDPEELHRLGAERGYRVAVRSGADPMRLDVVYSREDLAPGPVPIRAAAHPPRAATNDPARAALRRALPSVLREALQAELPAAMIPATIVVHDALPRTAGGKQDRRALADLATPRVEVLVAPEARPRTPAEAALAEVWGRVLGLPSVGVHANFFELGGDSIATLRVVSQAARAGLRVSSRQLFEHPTVAGLAAVATPLAPGGLGGTGPPGAEPPHPSAGASAPLSYAQERTWRGAEAEGFSASSVTGFALRLRGPVDEGALLAALRLLIGRHDALRTAIVAVAGELCQEVRPPGWIVPEARDLSALAPAAREATVVGCLREALGGLGERLAHIQLLTLGPEDRALIVNVHHALADGWSVGLLADELRLAYRALHGGRVPELPPLPTRLADHARWERGEGAGIDQALAYWRERLRGASALRLPTDHPRPARLSIQGGVAALPPIPVGEALRAFAVARDTTAFHVLLSAWQIVLAELSGQTDLVVGTIVANRERWELERVVGCFINLVPLRTDLAGATSFADVLGRTRATTLAAFEHQAAPFDAIVDALGVPREADRRPLVSVLFMLQNAPGTDRVDLALAPGVATEALTAPDPVCRFELVLSLRLSAAGVQGFVRYATDLFDRTTAERVGRRFAALLPSLLAAPDADVFGPDGPLVRTVDALA